MRISLTNKIVVGFGVIILFMVMSSMMSYFSMSRVAQEIQAVEAKTHAFSEAGAEESILKSIKSGSLIIATMTLLSLMMAFMIAILISKSVVLTLVHVWRSLEASIESTDPDKGHQHLMDATQMLHLIITGKERNA